MTIVKKTNKKTTKKINSPLRVGNSVFLRTVTCYYTGKIVGLTDTEILLSDAAWIAETGRFSQALASSELSEVEPYPDGVIVSVNRNALVDASDWKHALPRSMK